MHKYLKWWLLCGRVGICSNGGILRKISTYTVASLLIIQFEAIREMRDRFSLPIPDDKLADIPFFKPADDATGQSRP